MKVSGHWGWAIAVAAAATGCAPEQKEPARTELPSAEATAPSSQRVAQAPGADASVKKTTINLEFPDGWKPVRRPGDTAQRVASPDGTRVLSVERLGVKLTGPLTRDYAKSLLERFAGQIDTSPRWVEPLVPWQQGGQQWYRARFDAKTPDGPVALHWALTAKDGTQFVFLLVDSKGRQQAAEFGKLLARAKFATVAP